MKGKKFHRQLHYKNAENRTRVFSIVAVIRKEIPALSNPSLARIMRKRERGHKFK